MGAADSKMVITWKVPPKVTEFLYEQLAKHDQLTDAQKRQVFRLAIMIRNGSYKALFLAMMFDQGEISGEQLLDAI